MTADDFGHTDVLDEIWANNMHNTVSKGTNDRSSEYLTLYHKWLATVIYIFANHNEDIKEVEYLTYIYTLGGCAGFDVSASPEIVSAAKKGINAGIEKANQLKISIPCLVWSF